MPKFADTARKTILSQKLKRYVDLNTDYGQTQDKSFFEDEENSLLAYVSSVNIPCCVHDGDPNEVMGYIAKAKTFNCAVGAHIAYPDPANYGYQAMDLSIEELTAWIYVQMGAFRALTQANGLEIEHIRPHGALYGKFITDPTIARAVAETLYKINPWSILIGPAGPILEELHQKVGIRIAPEAYLGKRYNADGTLIGERFHENLAPQAVLDQARQLISDSSVTAQDGQSVKLKFSTLHLSPRLAGGVDVAEKLNILLGQTVPLGVAAVGTSGWL